MARDHLDALIDHLLREELGGDRPRDLTGRVLNMAKAHDRRRRAWWIGACSAIAAMLAIAITLWFVWPRHYPEPMASGDFSVAGGGEVQRGATLETRGKADLQIGGYVKATIDPQSRIKLDGRKFEEKIVLEKGGVACKVETNHGKFDVLVDSVTVHVTGTHFSVKVAPALERGRAGKWITVNVEVGEVIVNNVPSRPGPIKLAAKQRERFFLADVSNAIVAPAATRPATTRATEPRREEPKREEPRRERP